MHIIVNIKFASLRRILERRRHGDGHIFRVGLAHRERQGADRAFVIRPDRHGTRAGERNARRQLVAHNHLLRHIVFDYRAGAARLETLVFAQIDVGFLPLGVGCSLNLEGIGRFAGVKLDRADGGRNRAGGGIGRISHGNRFISRGDGDIIAGDDLDRAVVVRPDIKLGSDGRRTGDLDRERGVARRGILVHETPVGIVAVIGKVHGLHIEPALEHIVVARTRNETFRLLGASGIGGKHQLNLYRFIRLRHELPAL